MVYLGVDLHRKVSHVVALGETGEMILSRRFAHDREAFRRVFGELEPEPVSVAFEATYGWGWFADLLADAGIEAHMAHPLATKAISAGRVKNDAVDAGMLAHLLRTNLLPEAWIAPPEVREARRLVRMRASLVRIRSRLKCQVHALCADAGVPVPVSDLFGRTGRELLATLSLRPISAGRLAAHLRLIDDLGREIVAADREIVALFRGDDRIRRLLPIPGIGFLTAATVVAEVWDVGRFESADRLAGLGRADADRAQLGRPHAAGPYHQAGQPLAALVDGRGRRQDRPERGEAAPLRRPDRRATGDQDRPGRPRPPDPHPRLLCPPRRAGLPGLPAALSSVAPVGHGALATCHGLTRRPLP